MHFPVLYDNLVCILYWTHISYRQGLALGTGVDPSDENEGDRWGERGSLLRCRLAWTKSLYLFIQAKKKVSAIFEFKFLFYIFRDLEDLPTYL